MRVTKKYARTCYAQVTCQVIPPFLHCICWILLEVSRQKLVCNFCCVSDMSSAVHVQDVSRHVWLTWCAWDWVELLLKLMTPFILILTTGPPYVWLFLSVCHTLVVVSSLLSFSFTRWAPYIDYYNGGPGMNDFCLCATMFSFCEYTPFLWTSRRLSDHPVNHPTNHPVDQPAFSRM